MAISFSCNHGVANRSATEELQMPVVLREIALPVSRERAWELLCAPEEWLADDAALEAEPGGEVRAEWLGGDRREGVVQEVEPGERVRFRWWGPDGADVAEVEWRLVDAVAGTRVLVSERALAPVAWGPSLSALARASALALA
jgi:uncharacterized protein YndB with AHSA1/START domain